MKGWSIIWSFVWMVSISGHSAALAQGTFLNPYPENLPNGSDMPAPQSLRSKQKASFLNADGAVVPTVRLAYIIPINRTPQVNGVSTIRTLALTAQDWFRDQMRLHGYSPKAFRLEMEPDGVTPRVQIVPVSGTDAYLREDIWGHTLTLATSAGLTIWAPGEIWMLFTETQVQNPDSSVIGGVALGAGWGSGIDPGATVIGGDLPARSLPAYLTDNRPYAGNYLPEIGPYVLRQNISFADFEGTTFSSISSAAQGAFIHELGHALGLPHDFRNEWGAHGNIMGNGFRGFRGCFYPGSYSGDFSSLSVAAARVINTSRYFNDGFPESLKPVLDITSAGPVSTEVDGMVHVKFKASSNNRLASAVLTLDGDYVADQGISGTEFSGSFSVPYFKAGMANNYQVFAYDIYGNKQIASVALTPPSGSVKAPIPYIKVSSPLSLPAQTVLLDASYSNDALYYGYNLSVQWDLDGDQIFETPATFSKTVSVTLGTPGTRMVSALVSNPAGRKTVSAPVLIHTEYPAVTVSVDAAAGVLQNTWISSLGYNYLVERSSNLETWSSAGAVAHPGNAKTMLETANLATLPGPWSRVRISQRTVP